MSAADAEAMSAEAYERVTEAHNELKESIGAPRNG